MIAKNLYPQSNKTSPLRTFGVVSISVILFIILSPSILWLLLKSPTIFFQEQVYSQISPDKKFEIVVSRKVNFPADELIDPSITVYISLQNIQNNYEVNSVQFKLREFSDLENPEIIWMPDGVKVENIDTHKQFSFGLSIPNYMRQN